MMRGPPPQAWIEEMSVGIKALDPHHMVTTGVEVRRMAGLPAYKCVFAW